MAMPPYAYMQARATAPCHAQLEVVERGELQGPCGEVLTVVRPAQVFRGTDALRASTELMLFCKVCRDENAYPPDAGGWIRERTYMDTRYFEAYFDCDGEGISIAASGAEIYPIGATSGRPVVPSESLEEAKAAKKQFESGGPPIQRTAGSEEHHERPRSWWQKTQAYWAKLTRRS